MTTEEIARQKAADIVRLTLEENPSATPLVLSNRAIDAFLKAMTPSQVEVEADDYRLCRSGGRHVNVRAFQKKTSDRA